MLKTSFRPTFFLGLLLFVSSLLLGCAETRILGANGGCGENAKEHSGDYGQICTYVVVVTGFECPAQFPHEARFEGGIICSAKPFESGDIPKEICNDFKGGCQPAIDADGGMGCLLTSDCAEGELCNGDCNGPGVCIPKDQQACTRDAVEFCDCNGNIFVSSSGDNCQEERTMGRAENGSCQLPAGQCRQNADCSEQEYCDAPCGGVGECETTQTIDCGEAETLYCRCDGTISWSNTTCIFEPQGNRQPDGSCSLPSGQCRQNTDCAEQEYCDAPCGGLGECKTTQTIDCGEAETDYCKCNGTPAMSSTICIFEPHLQRQPDNGCLADGQCQTTSDCGENEYCDGECDEVGTCRTNAGRVCTDAPVMYCTCDGSRVTNPDSCINERYDAREPQGPVEPKYPDLSGC